MSVWHYAAQDGDMEITDLLLKAGAKPNAIDSDGNPPGIGLSGITIKTLLVFCENMVLFHPRN